MLSTPVTIQMHELLRKHEYACLQDAGLCKDVALLILTYLYPSLRPVLCDLKRVTPRTWKAPFFVRKNLMCMVDFITNGLDVCRYTKEQGTRRIFDYIVEFKYCLSSHFLNVVVRNKLREMYFYFHRDDTPWVNAKVYHELLFGEPLQVDEEEARLLLLNTQNAQIIAAPIPASPEAYLENVDRVSLNL